MPLYRYECTVCGEELVELVASSSSPAPLHCGASSARLMPRRVVGRVVPDSNGVHSGSGFARPARPQARREPERSITTTTGERFELMGDPNSPEIFPQQREVATPHDPADPTAIPEPANTGVFAKDFADCNAAERETRWRDTAEAVSAWHTRQLEAKGVQPQAARATAGATSQHTIERARAEASRADGLS